VCQSKNVSRTLSLSNLWSIWFFRLEHDDVQTEQHCCREGTGVLPTDRSTPMLIRRCFTYVLALTFPAIVFDGSHMTEWLNNNRLMRCITVHKRTSNSMRQLRKISISNDNAPENACKKFNEWYATNYNPIRRWSSTHIAVPAVNA
jgi:hypothetical protein